MATNLHLINMYEVKDAIDHSSSLVIMTTWPSPTLSKIKWLICLKFLLSLLSQLSCVGFSFFFSLWALPATCLHEKRTHQHWSDAAECVKKASSHCEPFFVRVDFQQERRRVFWTRPSSFLGKEGPPGGERGLSREARYVTQSHCVIAEKPQKLVVSCKLR